MTPEEQAGWDKANEFWRDHPIHTRPCQDCTAEYAAENRGLCIGFPGAQRYCPRCRSWWPLGRRYWARYSNRSRLFTCMACRRTLKPPASYNHAYYLAHREQRLAAKHANYVAHREERRAYDTARRQKLRAAARAAT